MATLQKADDKRPRWLRVLHRVGYVTTALVGLALLWIGFLVGQEWLKNRERHLQWIERNRTHEGPITASKDEVGRSSAVYLFDHLPPLSALHGDGIRFVTMPSFNRTHAAVAIYLPSAGAAKAEGVISTFDASNDYALLRTRRFETPAAAYRSLMTKMASITDGWSGSPKMWLDGTETAFEIVRGKRVTSGIGNGPDHYDHVAELMWTFLKQYAPGDDLPPRGDWEPNPKR